MFREILVPLDGSELSEASLMPARLLADHFGSVIRLLHVVEQTPPAEVHGSRHLSTAEEAEAYLREVGTRYLAGAKFEVHVHSTPQPDVATAIAQHATAEFKPDLIVMCTHGGSGLRDVVFGRIAQRIVGQCDIPLLAIKPGAPRFELHRILVPLDPDSIHDTGLILPISLAQSFRATLELLSVIPTRSTLTGEEAAASSLLPIASQEVLNLREDAVREHLQLHVAEITYAGVQVVARTARGDPVTQIVRMANEREADLIVLSTHRRAGLGAFWSKSVAPRVAQETAKPLLLIPV